MRGRMLLALLATSLATLAVSGLAVLPQLDRRVEADRVRELRGLARTIRPDLRELPVRARRRGAPELQALVERLQKRAGGRITVYDAAGAELADTLATRTGVEDPALREAVARRHDGVASGERDGVGYAVTVAGEPRRLTLVITRRVDASRDVADVVRAALPLVVPAGLAVALALGLVLSRGLSRRLGRLREDAEALGGVGLGHAVRVDGRDEVTVVARALEEMRRRLVEEQASRQEFVSTASHELRTPLASLQVTLELLWEELDDTARADAALRQTHRLIALAADLLDISRIDNGTRLALVPLELGGLAEDVAHEFAPRLEPHGRPLRVDGSPTLALADPAAVVRILRVLLDNAANYGAGRVLVSIQPDPRRVRLAVEDEGPGLQPDERERVFARFARGHAAAATRGTGLGLAIARGLARAMNGDLEAEPSASGARLVLSLNRAPTHP